MRRPLLAAALAAALATTAAGCTLDDAPKPIRLPAGSDAQVNNAYRTLERLCPADAGPQSHSSAVMRGTPQPQSPQVAMAVGRMLQVVREYPGRSYQPNTVGRVRNIEDFMRDVIAPQLQKCGASGQASRVRKVLQAVPR
jgi:hypothetical protein